jgi:hypothetical protein
MHQSCPIPKSRLQPCGRPNGNFKNVSLSCLCCQEKLVNNDNITYVGAQVDGVTKHAKIIGLLSEGHRVRFVCHRVQIQAEQLLRHNSGKCQHTILDMNSFTSRF